MKLSTLAAEFGDGVLKLTLFNPAAGNSFGITEAQELERAIDRFGKDTKILIFKSGHPQIFCSGGNLKQYAKLSKPKGIAANRYIRNVLERLNQTPTVKLAVVTGDCFGGGVELLSSFDFIWSTPSALFGLWQRRMGLVFGWGGEHRLRQRISDRRLREWALNAETITAQQALRLGLIDEIMVVESIEERLRDFLIWQLQLPQDPVAAIIGNPAKTDKAFAKLWLGPEHKSKL